LIERGHELDSEYLQDRVGLEGKIALVTGGARDIGRAVCLRIAEASATVVFSHSPTEKSTLGGLCTVDEIQKRGGRAVAIAADLTQPQDVLALVHKACDHVGGRFDILVNVAGGLVARRTMQEMDEAFWDHVMNLNLKSVWRLTKEILPFIPDGGTIVNIASQAGRDGGGAGSLAYATSKGALMTFTRALAKELGPRKIRVNGVCPGMINTDFHNIFTKPEVRAKVAAATPLGREGEAREVADLVAFLASSHASFINGANIDINGGAVFS
jgi:3-oxoacyl-[acyl-carrier protein] reductase